MFFMWWRARRGTQHPQGTRRQRPKPARTRSYRPCVEAFEDRCLLSTIHWITTQDGVWEDASNWSGGVVPGPQDDVVIDPNTTNHITIAHAAGSDSVQSLTSQQNLYITLGSSLTVTGSFSAADGTLVIVDQKSTFTAQGASTIDGANLVAQSGGQMVLTGATRYDASGDNFNRTLVADGTASDGTRSRINLSNVTTWRGAGSASNDSQVIVSATNQGVIDLSKLPQITAGNSYFRALDGGQLDLAALTTFTGASAQPGANGLEAGAPNTSGGAVGAQQLTTMVNGSLYLHGNAVLALNSLHTFQHGNITVTADGKDTQVGGVLTLPLTGIDESGTTTGSTFLVSGSGSRLDLSSVTTWKGTGDATTTNHVSVQAISGGAIDLSHLAQITGGNTYFQALDNGQINLAALTSFTGATAVGNANGLEAGRGGSITGGHLASLVNVTLYVHGTGTLPVGGLSTFQHGNILVTADNGAGGVLAVPVTAIDESTGSASPMFEADGSGSRLDLSSVTTWKGAGDATITDHVAVVASNGGVVDLSQLGQITGGNTYFQALDNGQINLAALTSFTGATSQPGANGLEVGRGGTIAGGHLASLVNVTLFVHGNGSLSVGSLSTFQHGNILVSADGPTGGSVVGGVLTLPLTSVDESGSFANTTFLVSGTGSRLDLSSITTWRGAGSAGNASHITVQASNGGVVDLSHLAQITGGNTYFQAVDNGQINLAALTSFTGATFQPGANGLEVGRGGTIMAGALTSLVNVTLFVHGTGTLTLGSLSTFQYGNILVTADAPAGGSAVGGVLTLPLTTIDESGASYSPTFQVDGMGSLLDLSSVMTWRGPGDASSANHLVVSATNGGVVNLSQLGQISAGNTEFVAASGSQINLAGLTSFTAPTGQTMFNTLEVTGGSTLTLSSGTTTLTNVLAFLDPSSTLKVGALQLSGSSLLTGSGTIPGNLSNDALVTVSASGDTFTVSGNYTQTAGTVTGLGTLTVNGAFTWAGGVIANGTVNANGGLSLSGDADKTLDGSTLNDKGSGTWTGMGLLLMTSGSVLNLSSTATLDIQNDEAILNPMTGTASVNNAGVLRKSAGTGVTSIQVAFSNSGTVQVATGALSLGGSFSNFANSTLTGGTYSISGILAFPGADITTNAATIVLDGPTAAVIDESGNSAFAHLASNTGSLTIQNGSNLATPGAFSNSGRVSILNGSILAVGGNYTQTAGSTTLNNGGLSAMSLVDIQGGVLSGSGTINGAVQNAGVIEVGGSGMAGLLVIVGDYTQTANGVLNIEIGGVNAGMDYDQFVVVGTATLDGTLNVHLINGFTPMSGETFQILRFAALQNSFAHVSVDPSLSDTPTYETMDVLVTAK